MNRINILLILSCFFFLSCNEEDNEGNTTPPSMNTDLNILLIIADDMGKDATNGYTEGSIKPNTPHLDSLMNNGLRFNNFWTYTVCSPTRASIFTGKYGYSTKVRSQFDHIETSETSLQAYINQETGNKYATAMIGKWHLGNGNNFNPETMGIDYYAGIISGSVQSYYSWQLTEDGVTNTETEYTTTKLTDLAIDWIDQQTKPWFLWLAYNAPHTPFHLPPSEMHSQNDLSSDQNEIDANPLPYYIASIEAMDYQIGQLIDQINTDERASTIIIFIGDNGSPGRVVQSPYSRRKAKGSLYQGGINSPMIVSGKNVNRTGDENALINSTDLFATIAALSGVNIDSINNSKDFSSLLTTSSSNFRNYTYSEYKYDDDNIDEWCIRNNTHKLIEKADGSMELYNLEIDPYENTDLLISTLSATDSTAKNILINQLATIRD